MVNKGEQNKKEKDKTNIHETFIYQYNNIFCFMTDRLTEQVSYILDTLWSEAALLKNSCLSYKAAVKLQ